MGVYSAFSDGRNVHGPGDIFYVFTVFVVGVILLFLVDAMLGRKAETQSGNSQRPEEIKATDSDRPPSRLLRPAIIALAILLSANCYLQLHRYTGKTSLSGMFVRLAFAVAAHLEPEILLVDEVLAVGDASFQKKCLGKMSDVAKEGRTVLFVSHNMIAGNSCKRVIWLNDGEIVEDGPS